MTRIRKQKRRNDFIRRAHKRAIGARSGRQGHIAPRRVSSTAVEFVAEGFDAGMALPDWEEMTKAHLVDSPGLRITYHPRSPDASAEALARLAGIVKLRRPINLRKLMDMSRKDRAVRRARS